MIVDRNFIRLAFLASVVTLVGAGCSGIHTSQGVSPATFLMPGLFGQAPTPTPAPARPAATRPDFQQSSVQILAHAR